MRIAKIVAITILVGWTIAVTAWAGYVNRTLTYIITDQYQSLALDKQIQSDVARLMRRECSQ